MPLVGRAQKKHLMFTSLPLTDVLFEILEYFEIKLVMDGICFVIIILHFFKCKQDDFSVLI